MSEEERRGPSFPWPIPEKGAEVEVAEYYRQATENRNGVERVFFIRIREVSHDVFRFIEVRSFYHDRDAVTGLVRHDFCIPCGDAEVEIASKNRLRWRISGASYVTAEEMKGRKVPASLEKVFVGTVGRVEEFASREEQRYEKARMAREEKEE